MRIDVHAHYYPLELINLFDRLNGPLNAIPSALWTDQEQHEIGLRLGLMDAAGVAIQVLSVSSLFPYFASEADAVNAARISNDLYAELIGRFPHRFRAFAALPLPHIEASLKELARTLDELGMAGVTVGVTVMGKSIADSVFEPLYAELNRRAAVLFMHPDGSACPSLVRNHRLTWPIGAPFEDTLFALHLIQKTIPIRYPKIRFIVPHLGGMLPMILPRLDNQAQMFMPPDCERPSVTARRLWYDTVGHGSIAALRCACAGFGAERLLLGSDYPYQNHELYKRAITYVLDALSKDDAELILDRNAAALLNLADMNK